jgi:hypothetical protein
MKAKLIVPNHLSEIKLWQYQKFLKIQEDNTDEKFLAMKLIEIFCQVDLGDVMKIKMTDVNVITDILTEMLEQKPELVREFELNGVRYGFIPNLEAMTLGEYVDLDTYLSNWQQMEYAMSVLYRPIVGSLKDKYLIEDYKAENQSVLKDMPMDAVFSSILFFYRLGIDLSTTMMNYLEQGEDKITHLQDSSLVNGDGINRFTHSLKEILHELNISLN